MGGYVIISRLVIPKPLAANPFDLVLKEIIILEVYCNNLAIQILSVLIGIEVINILAAVYFIYMVRSTIETREREQMECHNEVADFTLEVLPTGQTQIKKKLKRFLNQRTVVEKQVIIKIHSKPDGDTSVSVDLENKPNFVSDDE